MVGVEDYRARAERHIAEAAERRSEAERNCSIRTAAAWLVRAEMAERARSRSWESAWN